MSKASNPTRPHATSADVALRLQGLDHVNRQRLQQWGYPVAALGRIAEAEEQADAVDAVLAILTDRDGYLHDAEDLAMALRVQKTLQARMSPETHLIVQGKAERPHIPQGRFSSAAITDKDGNLDLGTWRTPAAVIGTVVVVLLAVAVAVVFLK